MKKTRGSEKALHRLKWSRPKADRLRLQFTLGESVLDEFVRSHDPSAVLIELVQNEYDAEGTRLEMLFGEDSVTITGKGKPVDRTGWNRLSVMMGTGTVAGSESRLIQAKVNSIGSKNFGLRSLFIYGDEIWIRSGGRQTVLDRRKGTLLKPEFERSSQHRSGIQIYVPYRRITKGDMAAFSTDKEEQALNRFSEDLAPLLMKLANPKPLKSLDKLLVSSSRCHRHIAWNQQVIELAPTNKSVKVLSRAITIRDSTRNEQSSKYFKRLEEVEFQKKLHIPKEFEHVNIPNYFRIAGGRIRLALSMRLRRGKVDLTEPGLFYYPLGLINCHTGAGISINAPFELDNDRTKILDPGNSPWNDWLIETAVDFTFELLITDWFSRFGEEIYLALDESGNPSITKYRDCLNQHMQNKPCWPTRARRRGRVVFACAQTVAIPAIEDLDLFLSDNQRLDKRLAGGPAIQSMAQRYGAKKFTVNSLVRLRCFGTDTSSMKTKLSNEEANYHYTTFPNYLADKDIQIQFSTSLDSHSRRLSKENRTDLRNSPTTLAADNSLQSPASPLWVVDSTIAEVCPVSGTQRLHPSLQTFRTLAVLCSKFDESRWTRETAQRIKDGKATEQEHEALYRYILRVHGHIGRKTQALVRKLPILRDHRKEWVAPYKITTIKSAIAKRLEDALHFPNRRYAGDHDLARAFRFKQKIEGNDIVEYARLIGDHPELAIDFDETLHRLSSLLTHAVVKQLNQIPILRNSDGELCVPTKLYIRNPLNQICLGNKAPYVLGKRIKLYKMLGCKDKPKADDIVSQLTELRANNKGPERLEIVYTALASALRLEGSPGDYYADKPIIWNGADYRSPEDTLMGSKYRRIFLEAVPYISATSSKLRNTYYSLGVCSQPDEKHWRQLLIWFGQKYQMSYGAVPEKERRVLRNAYKNLKCIPAGLPDDTKCFLDRNGILHDISDIRQGLLLIDDNPQITQIIDKDRIPVCFADISKPRTFEFFQSAGVKSITEFQQRVKIKIGQLIQPPPWFKALIILDKIHSQEFASALIAFAERLPKGQIGRVSPDPSKLQHQLGEIREIHFSEEIQGVYKIGTNRISVPEDCCLDGDSIVLVRVKSKSELYDLIARVIATILINDIALQRILYDYIYRLLDCSSIKEIERYLNSRGIPWKPTSTREEDWEEAEEGDLGNLIADAVRASVTRSKTGDEGRTADKPSSVTPTVGKSATAAPKQRSLPPLSNIKVNIVQPSDAWMPSPPSTGGGKGASSSWTPSTPSDEQWEREIGKRGEEIIYHQELKRVRARGYPESRVVWKAETNPDADFDILSADDDGEDLWIEVKATTGRGGRFLWPRSEFQKAIEKSDRYILWRVYEADTMTPSVKPFRDPVGILLRQGMRLDIDTFYAIVEPMSI